jgi:DNA-binding CsgD family transcriptional regulator/tetratricopeptide (TPR) repeat protein
MATLSEPDGMIDSVRHRGTSGATTGHFVGRAAELARLHAAFEAARAGVSGTVLVGGEAGVGKSRLVSEFVQQVDACGALALVGWCVELDGDAVPYAPIVAARRALGCAAGVDLSNLLREHERELARLLPDLGTPPSMPEHDDGLARARLFEAVLSVLSRLSVDRPIVLVVEDMHWADCSTRDLFGFVARALRDARVLLVATYRTDDLTRGHPLRPLLGELGRLPGVERVDLERFCRAEVAEQLHGLFGWEAEPALVTEVFERSEGNAFFAEELGYALLDGCGRCLPESLRDLTLARIDRLPEVTRRVLRVAAGGSSCVDHDMLVRVSGLPDEDLTEALRPAFEANVVTSDRAGTGYRFRHALTREFVHRELLPGERGRMHVRWARAYEDTPSAEIDEDWRLTEIAHHWYAAHDLSRALPAAVRAASAARERYAFAEELKMLERALALWERVERPDEAIDVDIPDYSHLLYRAARAASRSGNPERSLALSEEALAELDESDSPVLAAKLLNSRSFALRALGRADGLAELRRALELLGQTGHDELRLSVADNLAAAQMLAGEERESLALANDVIETAASCGARYIEANAFATRGSVLVHLGETEAGLTSLRRAVELADGCEPPCYDVATRAHVNLSSALTEVGRYEEAIAMARSGLDAAARFGRVRSQGALLRNNIAEPLIALGRWDEADKVLNGALGLDPPGVFSADLLRLRALISTWRGTWDDSAWYVTKARRLGGKTTLEGQYRLPLARVAIELAAWRGPVSEARAELRGALPWVSAGAEAGAWPLLASAARVEADAAVVRAVPGIQSTAPDEELIAVIESAAISLSRHTPSFELFAEIVAAELARYRGAGELAAWQAARSAAERAGSAAPAYLVAYVNWRAGEAQLATGDRNAAAPLLREAAASGRALGAIPLVREVETLAKRARIELVGEAPSVDSPGAARRDAALEAGAADARTTAAAGEPLGLTPREFDVLRLVAEGLSNGQIGERLFISTKTASVHVSNILAKLGVRSRGEAAAIAHQLRLFAGKDTLAEAG